MNTHPFFYCRTFPQEGIQSLPKPAYNEMFTHFFGHGVADLHIMKMG